MSFLAWLFRDRQAEREAREERRRKMEQADRVRDKLVERREDAMRRLQAALRAVADEVQVDAGRNSNG